MLADSVLSRRVVLVEDDELLQKQVVSALLRSFSDLDVRGARDTEEALRLLDDERSRLLITDAQNHHVDGMAVAASARLRRPSLPVIVIGNPPTDPSSSSPTLLAAAWLEKPPRVERLVGLVERMLEVPSGFSGEVTIDALPELVQLLSMANSSGGLFIEHGDKRGCVWFEKGAVVDAVVDGQHGVAGFYQMLKWEGGVFALDRLARAAQQTINLPPMQLLLEGVRLMDQERVRPAAKAAVSAQRKRTSERPTGSSQVRLKPVARVLPAVEAGTAPEPARTTTPPPRPAQPSNGWATPQQRAAESFQRGMEMAREKRYDAALQEWEHAASLDPDNRTYQVNLRRLNEVKRRSAATGETHGDQE